MNKHHHHQGLPIVGGPQKVSAARPQGAVLSNRPSSPLSARSGHFPQSRPSGVIPGVPVGNINLGPVETRGRALSSGRRSFVQPGNAPVLQQSIQSVHSNQSVPIHRQRSLSPTHIGGGPTLLPAQPTIPINLNPTTNTTVGHVHGPVHTHHAPPPPAVVHGHTHVAQTVGHTHVAAPVAVSETSVHGGKIADNVSVISDAHTVQTGHIHGHTHVVEGAAHVHGHVHQHTQSHVIQEQKMQTYYQQEYIAVQPMQPVQAMVPVQNSPQVVEKERVVEIEVERPVIHEKIVEKVIDNTIDISIYTTQIEGLKRQLLEYQEKLKSHRHTELHLNSQIDGLKQTIINLENSPSKIEYIEKIVEKPIEIERIIEVEKPNQQIIHYDHKEEILQIQSDYDQLKHRYDALAERFVIISAELTNARKQGSRDTGLYDKIKILETELSHYKSGFSHTDAEYDQLQHKCVMLATQVEHLEHKLNIVNIQNVEMPEEHEHERVKRVQKHVHREPETVHRVERIVHEPVVISSTHHHAEQPTHTTHVVESSTRHYQPAQTHHQEQDVTVSKERVKRGKNFSHKGHDHSKGGHSHEHGGHSHGQQEVVSSTTYTTHKAPEHTHTTTVQSNDYQILRQSNSSYQVQGPSHGHGVHQEVVTTSHTHHTPAHSHITGHEVITSENHHVASHNY